MWADWYSTDTVCLYTTIFPIESKNNQTYILEINILSLCPIVQDDPRALEGRECDVSV